MKNLFVLLLLIILLEGCWGSSQLYKVPLAKNSIRHSNGNGELIYNEDFKNAVEDIASKFGKRKSVIVYANDSILVWTYKRRQSQVKKFFHQIDSTNPQ